MLPSFSFRPMVGFDQWAIVFLKRGVKEQRKANLDNGDSSKK